MKMKCEKSLSGKHKFIPAEQHTWNYDYGPCLPFCQLCGVFDDTELSKKKLTKKGKKAN